MRLRECGEGEIEAIGTTWAKQLATSGRRIRE